MREVLVERGACGDTRLLQLNNHPRKSIDETHQIWPAGIEAANDGELADKEICIALRMLPIYDAQPVNLLAAIFAIRQRYGYAIFHELVNLTVRGLEAHGRAVAS